MKYFKLIIVALISMLVITNMLLVSASTANVVITKAGIDELTNKIVVEGSVNNGQTNTTLTLLILKPNAILNNIQVSDVLYQDQYLLKNEDRDAQNNSITYSFTQFAMPIDAITGNYKVIVTGEQAYNMGDAAETSFPYVGFDKVYESLKSIDEADINGITATIDSNLEYLLLDKKIYDDLSTAAKEIVNSLFVALEYSVKKDCENFLTDPNHLSKLQEKIIDFRAKYKKIISIGQFSDKSSSTQIKGWMDAYTNLYTFGQNQYDIDYDFDGQKDVNTQDAQIKKELNDRFVIYNIYDKNMQQVEKNKVLESLSLKNDLKSLDEIREAFYSQVLLKVIELMPWINTKTILQDLPERFNINYADFNLLNDNNKDRVYQKVAGGSYNALIGSNSVKEAFENIANEELKTQNSTQKSISGNSTSGGGSGGSFSFTPSVTVGDNGSDKTDTNNNQNDATNYKFNDITDVQWANEAIRELNKRGAINGKADGRFAPNDPITRAEFIKILTGAFNLVDEKTKTDFKDVKEGQWYYKYIASAQKYGITYGRNDGMFGVNDLVSRQDMVVLLYRMLKTVGIILPQSGQKIEFNDFNSIDNYAQAAIKEFTSAGIVSGMTNDTFAPQEIATRAQTAKIIYSLLKFLK